MSFSALIALTSNALSSSASASSSAMTVPRVLGGSPSTWSYKTIFVYFDGGSRRPSCSVTGLTRSALAGLIRTIIPAISYWRWQVLSGGGGVAFLSEIQLNATTILLQLRL